MKPYVCIDDSNFTLNPNVADFIPLQISNASEMNADAMNLKFGTIEVQENDVSINTLNNLEEQNSFNVSGSTNKSVTNSTQGNEPSIHSCLNTLRVENINRIIFAHININSIRNKFEMLSGMVKRNIDILVISETKIDETFPVSQFMIQGFSTPYRYNRTINGGGILLYVREDIPSKNINIKDLAQDIECLFVEINLYKKKWLIGGVYNPCKTMISSYLDHLSNCVDNCLPKYDNIILLGDFNSEMTETELSNFCEVYNMKNLVKEPTCYKI